MVVDLGGLVSEQHAGAQVVCLVHKFLKAGGLCGEGVHKVIRAQGVRQAGLLLCRIGASGWGA